MPNRDLFGFDLRDRFKSAGALRAAASRLASATKGLRCEQLAVELHDSIAAALPCPNNTRIRDVARVVRGLDPTRRGQKAAA